MQELGNKEWQLWFGMYIVKILIATLIDKTELNRLNAEYEEYNNKWGRYPYKINVAPDVSEKVSVYDQVMMNWEQFAEYVWSNKDN